MAGSSHSKVMLSPEQCADVLAGNGFAAAVFGEARLVSGWILDANRYAGQ